ncbi:hypothetical protein EDC96DRAFT_440112 [Choanephora cucurbitarum]|nr:hypothetical protein EDC96DRAFT_440112 [Choanephora cucurbitarum]
MWIIYSLIIWIVCLLYLFREFVNQQQDSSHRIYAAIPVGGLPVIIYHVRKLLVWWYETRQKKEELQLAKLRKEQKEKIEDLKKRTSYYTTQSLLEKYDDALQKKKKEEEQRQQQQQKKPVSMPVRHPNQPQQQQQQARFPMQPTPRMQPILPPTRTEPQWYDRIVDALVGDVGPETKYALICNHCYSHNGLVMKEEFDTIQYVCPHCKQFNPSRQSKHIVPPKPDINLEPKEDKEEDDEEVLSKLKADVLQDNNQTIGSRVRQRHAPKQDEEEEEE